MTTDTHDTAAALEAAIDEYGCAMRDDYRYGGSSAEAALDDAGRAITAHVEASIKAALREVPEIDAAIDAVIGAVRDDIGSDGMDAARTDLDRAIAAHVEAEVARRLAAAPEVEAAIETHGDACYERGFRHALKSDAVDSELDAAYDRLRAAFAADKARAVESARLTPDEARRLVEAFAAAHGALVLLMHGGQYDPFDDEGTRRSAADTARTALLRALGVEA